MNKGIKRMTIVICIVMLLLISIVINMNNSEKEQNDDISTEELSQDMGVSEIETNQKDAESDSEVAESEVGEVEDTKEDAKDETSKEQSGNKDEGNKVETDKGDDKKPSGGNSSGGNTGSTETQKPNTGGNSGSNTGSSGNSGSSTGNSGSTETQKPNTGGTQQGGNTGNSGSTTQKPSGETENPVNKDVPLESGNQEAVTSAGLYKVTVSKSGQYCVMVKDWSESSKGYELLEDFLAEMGYVPTGLSGRWLDSGEGYMVYCTGVEEKTTNQDGLPF